MEAYQGPAENRAAVGRYPPDRVSIWGNDEIEVGWRLDCCGSAVRVDGVSACNCYRQNFAVGAQRVGRIAASFSIVGNLADRRDRTEADNRASSGHDVGSVKSGVAQRAKRSGFESLWRETERKYP